MTEANDKNEVSFGSLDAKDEVEPCMQPKGISNYQPDRCFKSYRHDPLAWLIIDRLGLTPLQFALVMIGMTALLYALAAALYAVLYPSGIVGDFLIWARRSWAQLVWLLIPPVIMGFYCWINIATGCLFGRLIKDDIVEASDGELRDIVMSGKGSIQEAYNRSAWTVASLLVMVLAVVLSVMRPGFRQAVGAIGSDIVLFNVVMLPFLALQVYIVSMMVAKEVITIRSLGKFFKHATLRLRPLHPDRCGGLRRLHDYAITVNYVIAVVGLGLCLLSYLSFQAGDLATNYLLHFFLGGYLILAPYCFFATLGTAHQAMKSAKESFLRNISEQFQSAYAETQERLTSKRGELQDSLDKIEQLQKLHKLTQSFPVWPFDVGSIRRFVVTIAAPLVWTTVAAIIDRLL